ncbi:hypothetical protein An11g10640 [Aspergillus niger]|uniref:Uncharacterized protein n=2 Tax=Aspergillus niger TaxID=5061 RepID=A2QXY2_ASPNC|nr:hypothetical protein An11g10640 [Aspergillus niger]CAK40862.1 hypothetical protein An11g10640 [Aspergillus niger]
MGAYPFQPGLSRTIEVVGDERREGRDFKAWTSPCAPPCSANFGYGVYGWRRRGERRYERCECDGWVSLFFDLSFIC